VFSVGTLYKITDFENYPAIGEGKAVFANFESNQIFIFLGTKYIKQRHSMCYIYYANNQVYYEYVYFLKSHTKEIK